VVRLVGAVRHVLDLVASVGIAGVAVSALVRTAAFTVSTTVSVFGAVGVGVAACGGGSRRGAEELGGGTVVP